MIRIEAVRKLKFDAGHRVVNHESKCANLHGHEYHAEIYCDADNLDGLGRVIDFSVIKEVFGKWIDENLDHTMIIWDHDPLLGNLQRCIINKPFYITSFNPTAENLALHLIEVGNRLLNIHGVRVTKMRLHETSNCYVEVSSDKN